MKWFKKLGAMMMVCLLCTMNVAPAQALSSSKSFTSGYAKGDVITKDYAYKYVVRGIKRGKYMRKKYVFQSERVILNKHAKEVGQWCLTEDVDRLTVTKSNSVSVSGSADIAKKMKLSTSVGVSVSSGASFKVNPAKGKYCRLSIMCDYLEVTYIVYTYNSSGKQIGKVTKTFLAPINNTATYYVQYKN